MNAFYQRLLSRFLGEKSYPGHRLEDEHRLRRVFAYAPNANPKRRHAPTPRPDFALFDRKGNRTVCILRFSRGASDMLARHRAGPHVDRAGNVAEYDQGLIEYASVLVGHAIGIDDVIYLTDADLISLGIASADRKRLLEAITALRQSRVGAPANSPDHQASAGAMARGAERRQVSVLFCDIDGSTEIAHRLDPEELAIVMEQDHKAASDTIRHMGGYVAQLLGDGVVAYFGWLMVHEDDAERAVAAGLELAELLPRLSSSDGPSWPFAWALRPVSWWSAARPSWARDSPMGTTPALAARKPVQAIAPENAIDAGIRDLDVVIARQIPDDPNGSQAGKSAADVGPSRRSPGISVAAPAARSRCSPTEEAGDANILLVKVKHQQFTAWIGGPGS